jgi:hypothetical protein
MSRCSSAPAAATSSGSRAAGLELWQRQGRDAVGILLVEERQHVAVQRLVDVEVAEAAGGDDADPARGRPRLDGLAGSRAEAVAAAGVGWLGG